MVNESNDRKDGKVNPDEDLHEEMEEIYIEEF